MWGMWTLALVDERSGHQVRLEACHRNGKEDGGPGQGAGRFSLDLSGQARCMCPPSSVLVLRHRLTHERMCYSCQMIINRARDCVVALGPFLLGVQALDQLIDDMRGSFGQSLPFFTFVNR